MKLKTIFDASLLCLSLGCFAKAFHLIWQYANELERPVKEPCEYFDGGVCCDPNSPCCGGEVGDGCEKYCGRDK